MKAPSLIICERTGRWAVAFRRAVGKQKKTSARNAELVEVRSLAACAAQLNVQPGSIVAVEVTSANLELVLGALLAWQRRYPQAPVVVLTDESLAAADHLLREAGALAVLRSTRDVPQAVKIMVRLAASLPPDNRPLEEAILSQLPWPKWAATSA